MENTFPPALVERINSLKVEGVSADFVKLGGVKMADPSGYRVIIDRISHDILCIYLFPRGLNCLGFDRLRHDDDAVDVGDNQIAR